MLQAYSRLKTVLNRQKISIPELHRRMERQGIRVNLKSLYRLSNEGQPLQRLDLRVAGAICQVCEVTLSDLVDFEVEVKRLARLSATKQKRLDALMAKNNDGKLTKSEAKELRDLVSEVEAITVRNARLLTQQQKKLATATKH